MRALVTGGNGFLGSHLCRALCRAGWRVRALVQPGTDTERLAGLDLTCVEGDLLSPPSLEAACAGVGAVFHLAGIVSDWGPRRRFFEVNVGGCRNLLGAARGAGARRLVFVSSLAVHRYTGITDGDETRARDNGDHPYGGSKIACEDLLLDAHRRGDIEAVIVRPGVVPFGRGDRLSLPQILKNRRAYAHVAGGDARLCTAYAPNLAHGMVRCGEHPAAAGQVYVLSDAEAPTWRQFITALFHKVGLPPPTKSLPLALARAVATAAEAWAKLTRGEPAVTHYRVDLVSRDCVFSSRKAAAELEWTPRVGLDEALDETAHWLTHDGSSLWRG